MTREEEISEEDKDAGGFVSWLCVCVMMVREKKPTCQTCVQWRYGKRQKIVRWAER